MISIVRAASATILLSAVLGLSATRAWTGDINVFAYAHVDSFDAGDPKFEIEPSAGGCGPAPADEMECGDGD
jgi:hypothetical protein